MVERHDRQVDTIGTKELGTLRALPREACAETLAQHPFFASMDRQEVYDLVSIGVQLPYVAGAELIEQGQPSIGLFVVLQGRLRVTQRQPNKDTLELALLGPGEMFGELSLLDELPRMATVTAVEPTLAFAIPILDFRLALKENSRAAIRLLVLLSQRAHNADSRAP